MIEFENTTAEQLTTLIKKYDAVCKDNELIVHDKVISTDPDNHLAAIQKLDEKYMKSMVYGKIVDLETIGKLKVLKLPRTGNCKVPMQCACGEIGEHSVNVKHPQLKGIKNIDGEERLHCKSCYQSKLSAVAISARSDVEDRLTKECKVTLLEPYQGYRVSIKFKCGVCATEWNTTPQVISMAHSDAKDKGRFSNGCPGCRAGHKSAFYSELVETNRSKKEAAAIKNYADQVEAAATELEDRYGELSNDDLLTLLDSYYYSWSGSGSDFTLRSEVKLYNEFTKKSETIAIALAIINYQEWMQEPNVALLFENIRIVEQHGYRLLDIPSSNSEDIDMICSCGHEHRSNLLLKLRNFETTGMVTCANCVHEQSLPQRANNFNEVLQQYGLSLDIESYKGYEDQARIICTRCDHEFDAIPRHVATVARKGQESCGKCQQSARADYRARVKEERIAKWREFGVELIDPSQYSGLNDVRNPDGSIKKLNFRNVNCGHEFEAIPATVRIDGIHCSVCGKERVKQHNINKGLMAILNRPADFDQWLSYRRSVHTLTQNTYKKYKDVINPHDLPRGLAGTPGAYQLDHIVAVRQCYDAGVPEELCSHVTNLRMLTWEDNLKESATMCDDHLIPEVLREYFM